MWKKSVVFLILISFFAKVGLSSIHLNAYEFSRPLGTAGFQLTLREWVRTLEDQGVEVESDVVRNPEQLRSLLVPAKLSKVAETLFRRCIEGTFSEEGLAEEKEIRALAQLGKDGPSIQKGLVAEAVCAWRAHNKEKAKSLLEAARKIHPEGKVPVLMEMKSESEFADLFLLFLKENSPVPKGNCKLELHLKKGESGYANGFPLTEGKVSIGSGVYYFEKRRGNYCSEPVLVRGCESVRRLGSSWGESMKIEFSTHYPKNAWALVAFQNETPWVFRLNEDNQWRALGSWKEAESARVDVGKNLALSFEPENESVPLTLRAEEPQEKKEKWYNNSTLWWVAGGVLAAGVGAYLLSHDHREVQPIHVSVR